MNAGEYSLGSSWLWLLIIVPGWLWLWIIKPALDRRRGVRRWDDRKRPGDED